MVRSIDKCSVEHVDLMGLQVSAITEARAVQLVAQALAESVGGWICPVNLDVLRQYVSSEEIRAVVRGADLVVADGMPLIWASRLQGTPLPERVAGSSLVTTLSAELGRAGRSIFLLGGNEGTAEAAGKLLSDSWPGLKIAGWLCPPFGFERSPGEIEQIENELGRGQPDVVFVGLGFPKQDLLITRLRQNLPNTWFVSCGISFSFVVGEIQRAPWFIQVAGLEWAHRLMQEPRRLAQRYLLKGPPFAIRLFLTSVYRRALSAR